MYKVEVKEKKHLLKRNGWIWRIVASNGRIVDSSTQSFANRQIAEENMRITCASIAAYFNATIYESPISESLKNNKSRG